MSNDIFYDYAYNNLDNELYTDDFEDISPPPLPPVVNNILQEDGFFLLQEDSFRILEEA